MKTGILLLNLGSPDAPQAGPVRRYLREFLSDPRVIDINPLGRALLLNLIILPFRPRKSAEAYQQVWTERGSPLIFHTADLAEKLAAYLEKQAPGKYSVRYAMRYGNPSTGAVLEEFAREGVSEIRALPLYPQYASSSTGSAVEELYRRAGETWNTRFVSVLGPFFQHPDFIKVLANIARENLTDPDHVLFTYHGLPERQIRKSDRGNHCLTGGNCCDNPGDALDYCYRAQCYATSRKLAEALKLPADKWSVSFQSRLGRTPWIQPYTDEVIKELPGKGVKKIAVMSPSFTADCLETLEELNIRAREDFLEAGGEEFQYIPCPNARDDWVQALAGMVAPNGGS